MISSPLGKPEVRMTFGRVLQERFSLSSSQHNHLHSLRNLERFPLP